MTKTHRRFVMMGCAAAALALTATACGDGGSSGGSGGGSHSMTIRYGAGTAAPDVSGGFYSSLPGVLGFWKDQGLKVDQINLNGAGSALQALQANRVDVANSGTNLVSPALQTGVKAVG